MKIDRLIAIVTILLQQDKITAPALAQRFEVSRRTINRDIENICKAGIPLVTTQGYGGGISIADGYKIDKTFFTGDELQTVLAALKGIDTISNTSYLARLSDKLFRKDYHILAEDMIVIDLASHYQKPLTEKIETIKKAIWSKQYIAFWYCLDSEAYRLFKLNRLWELEVLADQFSSRHIKEEELCFNGFLEAGNFHLKALFAESEKHRLIDEYGIGCYSANKNGYLLFEWNFASYANMREWIFSFGDRVTILEPISLHEDRVRQAENILKKRDE